MSDVKLGIIGGTGLGEELASGSAGPRHEVETPFGRPSDAIVEVQWDGLPLLLLSRHGAGHVLGPSRVPYRANIFALKKLGCTHIIASGAVGSLREEFRPRDLVVPDQVIDRTFARERTFFEQAAVHIEFAEPFCPVLRPMLLEAARMETGESARGAGGETAAGQPDTHATVEEARSANNVERPADEAFKVHDRGCYVCMEGPAFSTRAESLMHRLWGGDLIGMTCMPEAKLAREAEMAYALVALVTDYDCWRSLPGAASPAGGKQELLREIIGNLKAATANAMRLVRRVASLIAQRRESLRPSPAHGALELAVWSDKNRIPREEVQRLSPLWIRYFGEASGK
jgi:5'-methylthioadenosine phosphorylase